MAVSKTKTTGILTHGGTFLGSSRDTPHKMTMGGKVMDMTEVAVSNAQKLHIDCLVCLGGNGTQKNAMRLHTTASSHHRAIVCEIMGHKAGWPALGSGIAGGADVILIPEIPYNLDHVVEHLMARRHHNKRFSIIAVAEGAISKEKALEGRKKKKPLQKEEEDGTLLIEEPIASRLGTKASELLADGIYNVMVGVRGEECVE